MNRKQESDKLSGPSNGDPLSTNNKRGDPQSPCSVAADPSRKLNRVLALKVDINWKDPASKKLYERLRELGWQAARYRNAHAVAIYAQQMKWRVDPDNNDPNDITKQVRTTKKEELSGAAYSSAENEVKGAFARDAKRIYAGQPFPQWKPTAALSIKGSNIAKADSGIKLEIENGRYVAEIAAQSKHCPGGCWLRLPIAKNTRRDEYQAPILDQMVSWAIPIAKATIQIKPHGIILRLTYAIPGSLPRMGNRVGVIGPITAEGRLLLRTETQTKDYTSKLAEIISKKDSWDLIRRRLLTQIGRRHGHARLKREQLARKSWTDWLNTYLHTWTREIIAWSLSQGLGQLSIESIANGDWPADRFIQLLRYKAEAAGIVINDGADVGQPSGERAAKAIVAKRQRTTRKRREAERELLHQLAER